MSFWEEIRRPFNQLNLALAVLGVGLAFYFYYFPRNDKGVAYSVEGPSTIYDSKINSPAIRLVDAENTPITSDTYLQTFTVWNTGSSAIEPSDVRRPISFIFQGAERVLDMKVVSATDPDICGFQLTNTRAGSNQIVSLSWKHFDPKKAVKFQVIYCQQTKPAALISADIVGISKLQPGVKQKQWIQILAVFGMAVFWAYQTILLFKASAKYGKNYRWIPLSFAGVLAIAVTIFTWVYVTKALLPTQPL